MSYKMVHQDKWYSGLFTLVIKTLFKDICVSQNMLEFPVPLVV